ncbi:phage portal protein [Microbacterium sp. No. 7]|uniref:phage portal protein n=1 Tax=Microbacterium sp. No. 7 TaxID=1714373 RepID=UPI0006CFF837|nr:phage portal protein [Microbacterium sp. No. 7]
MALLDRLMRSVRVTERTLGGPALTAPLVSPLAGSTSQISRVVFSEFFAGEIAEVTREGALMIPPLKRGRDILVGTVAGMPLREFEGGAEVTPDWLHNSASGISPWHRMAATIDDLIFYDWSAWTVKRDSGGTIVDAVRIPYERWAIDDYTGVVTVDGNVVSAEEIVVFPGNGSGGILATGATTIKGYRALERSWTGRAQNPIPLVELHQTSDDPLTDGDDDAEDDEIGRLIDEWAAARLSPNGAVGYTPHNIEVRTHGTTTADLFVEGRNAAVLDIARLLNMPAALLDGSMSTASLTYSTTQGKQNEFATYTIPAWTDPIEARLSLDDVSGKGRVIRFDRSALVSVEQEPVTEPRND